MHQIEEAAERYHLRFAKLSPIVWTSVADSGIKLTLRYLCRPRERRASENEMWESILTAFDELDDVDLAYPTIRYFNHRTEAKVLHIEHQEVGEAPRAAKPPEARRRKATEVEPADAT